MVVQASDQDDTRTSPKVFWVRPTGRRPQVRPRLTLEGMDILSAL